MASSQVKRIGVLTGGGDCPGLNAVIRSLVKTSVTEYGWEVIGYEDGFEGLLLQKFRPLSGSDVRGLLPRGGTILGTTNRCNPFRYQSEIEGRSVEKDMSQTAIQNFHSQNLDALVVIGGEGSLKIALELHHKGLPVVGVPKTIDNDLDCTEVTFGFYTAVETAKDAIDKLHTTGESHHRIMILEVMGRTAGWIALEAGLAGGTDLILIPEIPYDIEEVCRSLLARKRYGFGVAVVAEGARSVTGETVTHGTNALGFARYGGIGYKLGAEIAERTGLDVRVTVLGHLQRGGSPCAYDRILATRFGAQAAHAVASGKFGDMVALHAFRVNTVSIKRAVAKVKLIPPDSELVRTARDIGISFGDPAGVPSSVALTGAP
ncbi:MAG: 6-phosphofructokinase [Armatimonadetes bacterium]|nr:6-phosphofructokinase [Armatimonadota bacterium]